MSLIYFKFYNTKYSICVYFTFFIIFFIEKDVVFFILIFNKYLFCRYIKLFSIALFFSAAPKNFLIQPYFNGIKVSFRLILHIMCIYFLKIKFS